VTRESVLALIEEFADELKVAMQESTGQANVKASSRDVTVSEISNAAEAFATGTAAELGSIASLKTGKDEEAFEKVFKYGASTGGPVTATLLKFLREAMVGKRACKATEGWLRDPRESPKEFCKPAP
jgi:branched-subunit amino acid aminotransferase/4-amino-4-deoxychorismate lyase